jgi:glycosyltransferase involved in cell wall biosynthesis
VNASTLRRALGFAEDDYVIGLSAVLRPEKNPVQLVEAIAHLCKQGLPARALFIGDGPERASVEARARALGVADRVVISGFQDDVRPFLSVCDVVALTSFTEAFSLAAIEAMALGRPVVHPDVGGAAEMIQSGQDGWLFPVGDTATLVERLGVLADPVVRARMGENARATVAQRFAERAMVEHYEALLIEICATGSKREQLRKRATAH